MLSASTWFSAARRCNAGTRPRWSPATRRGDPVSIRLGLTTTTLYVTVNGEGTNNHPVPATNRRRRSECDFPPATQACSGLLVFIAATNACVSLLVSCS